MVIGARIGALLAAVGLVGVLAGDGPALRLSSLSPWIVAWSLGLFALLALAPFAIHARIADREHDRDRRWELAVVAWGGVALAAGIAFGAIALAAGFDTGSRAGALAVVGLGECALVLGSLLTLMFTTG